MLILRIWGHILRITVTSNENEQGTATTIICMNLINQAQRVREKQAKQVVLLVRTVATFGGGLVIRRSDESFRGVGTQIFLVLDV